jgi:chemotaxis protein methyltransferase CheR
MTATATSPEASASAFDFVRTLLRTEAGIVVEPGKEYLVDARLLPVARSQGLDSVDALVRVIRSGRTPALRRVVLDAMTTNETTFFRDVQPFEALQTTILPRLIEARSTRRELRIWYAASSTGQEPYSVSMIVRDQFPELLTWKLEQVGTDISRPALERARAGRYSQLEVNRGLPAKMLVKFFRKEEREWLISDDIRRMVQFEELNLNAAWPPRGRFDIVFMRNVMIYFDVEAKKRILGNVYDMLAPDGYLFLGAAETTFNLDNRFQRLDINRAGCYQRVDPATP